MQMSVCRNIKRFNVLRIKILCNDDGVMYSYILLNIIIIDIKPSLTWLPIAISTFPMNVKKTHEITKKK